MVEARTGAVLLETTVPRVYGAVDGFLHDGILLVRHAATRGRNSTMTAFDIATTVQLWHRDDLAPVEQMNSSLRVWGGLIPALVRYGQSLGMRNVRLGLALIDIRTGENVGTGIDLLPLHGRIGESVDVEVCPGVMVVGTSMGIIPFQTVPLSDQEEAGAR